VLVPSLREGLAEACFVRTDPAHVAAVRDLLPTHLQHDGALAIASPRLFSGAFTVDYSTAFEDRPLRWVWVAAAGLVALLWALVQWFGRARMAIYATFGMRVRSRLVLQFSEWSILAAAGGLWGWALGTVGAIALGTDPILAARYVGYHVGLTILTASAAVVVLGLRPTGTLLNALKDR